MASMSSSVTRSSDCSPSTSLRTPAAR
jgi:hypothetical protein